MEAMLGERASGNAPGICAFRNSVERTEGLLEEGMAGL
jgi:hypothetical protein